MVNTVAPMQGKSGDVGVDGIDFADKKLVIASRLIEVIEQ